MNILRVGERARAALVRSRGLARPLAAFADSPYLQAHDEIIWVGAQLPAMHPRAVLTEFAPPRGVALRFDTLPEHGWSPQLPVTDDAGAVITGAKILRRNLAQLESPRGFGVLLAGRPPAFPLDIAVPRVRALVGAYARNDAGGVVDASIDLLGFGTGLTPSGDDLAGAALFGRLLVAPHDAAWPAAAAALTREAATRSHAISAALFADLARGQSFAPLHATVDALAADDGRAALAAAQSLAGIGHSSGWDMLTGLIAGIAGTLD